MRLVEKRKFDLKNRLYIPIEYIRMAGGDPNGEAYVTFDEETKKIEVIVIPQSESAKQNAEGGGD